MKEILHIYTRVSSTIQEEDGTSLTTQKELGIETANKLGMGYKVWNEGGKSSSSDTLENRPVLTELLSLIDSGEIKHLYVWNTDRLSRNLSTWGMIRFKLIQNDITLHTPTGKQMLSDLQTNLMIGILSEISNYDNKLRTERFRLGKLYKIKQGGWIGGPPPYGYKIVKSKLVPDDKEKKWVKFIFENYSKGDSVDEIRTKLLKNGVVTRRGKPVWSHGSINALLTNTHYGGYFKYTDKKSNETIRITCEAILSSSLIKKVKDIKKKRSYTTGGRRTKTSVQKYIYLLGDLLFCGHCGSRYGGNYKKTQTSYYSCNQKTNKFKTKLTDEHFECTTKRNIRIDTTDDLVWNTVIDTISKSHLFKEQTKIELLKDDNYKLSKTAIKDIKKKIKKIEEDIKVTTDGIIQLEINHVISKRNKEESRKIIEGLEDYRLESETKKEKLLDKLNDEEANTKWIDWIRVFSTKVEDLKNKKLDVKEKKKILEGIIESITVYNINKQEHELKIKFRLPFVDDDLLWNDTNDKSKGYTLRDGKNIQAITGMLLKKKDKNYIMKLTLQ